jgi:hypothetical protein
MTTSSPESALPECEALAEPEAMQPPVGEIPAKTPSETPLKMASKSCQIAPDDEKTARKVNPLVKLGKLLTRRFKRREGINSSHQGQPGYPGRQDVSLHQQE